jgi:hypothetical protein
MLDKATSLSLFDQCEVVLKVLGKKEAWSGAHIKGAEADGGIIRLITDVKAVDPRQSASSSPLILISSYSPRLGEKRLFPAWLMPW